MLFNIRSASLGSRDPGFRLSQFLYLIIQFPICFRIALGLAPADAFRLVAPDSRALAGQLRHFGVVRALKGLDVVFESPPSDALADAAEERIDDGEVVDLEQCPCYHLVGLEEVG